MFSSTYIICEMWTEARNSCRGIGIVIAATAIVVVIVNR